MAAPHRAHVCAQDCALAAQWPATSGRDMKLFRASDCALAAVIFTPGCATRWPLSREASHDRWLFIVRRLRARWHAGCSLLRTGCAWSSPLGVRHCVRPCVTLGATLCGRRREIGRRSSEAPAMS
ncbi:hypothetical protein F511_46511 [Dorcoceras hygrometricum]|uniref:Uncharacterized protein n=1 Tax=Dorcoceras hygrometricum TaxID=472368 RepID=A0A2Z6ZTB8_9LAMI|nr:hypothetical protein F511_46511 [Dorcoceras hygrometricum]